MKIKEIESDANNIKKKDSDFNKSKNTDTKIQSEAQSFVITPRIMARRYSSEKQLESIIDWELKEGMSYHIISQGDIDSLTFLRHIIKQQYVKEVIVSTWCMAMSDLLEMERWIKNKRIKIIHFYIGEIFKSSYAAEYEELLRLQNEGKVTVCIFRNHSKVMCGHGSKFSFVIESSANVNTNPRCENTVITIDKQLCDFYQKFYNGIISF